MYTVSQKIITIHLTFGHNFGKWLPIFKFFFNYYRIFLLTLTMLLRYLAN